MASISRRPVATVSIQTENREVSKFPESFAIHHLNQRRTIALKSRLKVIYAVDLAGGKSFGSEKRNDKGRELFLHAVGELGETTSSSSSSSKEEEVELEEKLVSRGKNRNAQVVVAAAVTVVLGVGNRVLYKLALVPLKHYPFFLAQFATFGYVVVYFSVLYVRYRSGKVTSEMLALPKAPFVAVGFLEALGAACGMAAGAILSGAAIPILSQSFLVWQLLLSFVFLGRRYSLDQLLGCFLVAVGVIITVASGTSTGSLAEAGIFWSLLMILSFLFQAADTVLKEIIFLDAAQRLKGGTLDLFVVNSFGSAFQAVFICLLLPFMSKLWGIPFNQLPSYIKDGAACFLNIGTVSSGCDGAPLLPLLFVMINMGFNVSLLHLLKISSAVVSCLASTVSVPVAVFLFTLPLPYLGVPSSLPPGFVAGGFTLVLGMFIYAWTPLQRLRFSRNPPSIDPRKPEAHLHLDVVYWGNSMQRHGNRWTCDMCDMCKKTYMHTLVHASNGVV